MKFRYAAELRLHPSCPPDDASSCTRDAFRFVFKDIADDRNFLPVAKSQPQRRLLPNQRCMAYSLSMWATRKQAESAYASFVRQFQNFRKTAGTQLASGKIQKSDGVACKIRRDGHFSFFESTTAELAETFEIVCELCQDEED